MNQEIGMPASMLLDGLVFWRNALGLKYYTAPMRHHPQSSRGVCDVIEGPPMQKVVVEVLTQYAGFSCRILVLVVLGLGCTAWYSFMPVVEEMPHTFPYINDYAPFYNEAYTAIDMKRVSFTEVNKVEENVAKILDDQTPFKDLNMLGQRHFT